MTIELQEYFDIKYGVNLNFADMIEGDEKIPFVGRTEKNNGIVSYVKKIDNIKLNPANTISVACGGTVLESFLQEKEYYSGRDIYIIKTKINLTKIELLYYCMCIKANTFKYSYGRQANKTLKYIQIPSKNEIPQWVYEIKIPVVDKQPISKQKLELNTENWKPFKIGDLFKIKGPNGVSLREIELRGGGVFPFVVTSSENNGIAGFYNHWAEEGGVLTIDSATIGSCFYQEKKFSASDHVEKLIPQFDMNVYVAMFFVTLINMERYRYGYGRKFAQKRIKETIIKLPVDKNNNPDFEFMENYIKSLNYSKNLF